MEQVETAAQAKARRGPKAKILRQLTRIHTPATATGAGLRYVTCIGSLLAIMNKLYSGCMPGQPVFDLQIGQSGSLCACNAVNGLLCMVS